MYRTINEAICDIFLDRRYEGRPIYLVLDNSERSELSRRLGVKQDKIEAHVCQLVGKSLSQSGNPYLVHEEELRRWLAGRMAGRPPYTALLYTLSHAAELMVSDGDFSSANYYRRLAAVTGIDHGHLSAYGHATEKFWLAFGKWLIATNYVFGRPTARAINKFKYVSMAISQAILREADRRCFHHLFEKYRFGGTDVISTEEIYQYISSWISGSGATQKLRAAWARLELRPRICEIAIAELSEWSRGSISSAAGPSIGSMRLSMAAAITVRFPSRLLSLAIGRQDTFDSELEVKPTEGGSRAVLGNSIYGNFATLGPASAIDIATVLMRGADYTRSDDGRPLQWTPRSIIPLCLSDKGSYWTEVTRVMHGTEHLVLVRAESQFRDEVEQHLARTARPGYTVATPDILPGLPPDWLLYEKVRILHSNDRAAGDLLALSPVSDTSSLQLVGGVRLGQGIWHRNAPPQANFEAVGKVAQIEASDGIDSAGTVFATSEPTAGVASFCPDPKAIPASGTIFLQAKSGPQVLAAASYLCRSANTPRPLDRQGEGLLAYRSISTAEEPQGQRSSEAQNAPGLVIGCISEFEPHQRSVLPILDAFTGFSPGGNREESAEQDLAAEDVIASTSKPAVLMPDESVDALLKSRCEGRGFHVWAMDEPGDGLVINECKRCGRTVLGKAPRSGGSAASNHLSLPETKPVPLSTASMLKAGREPKYNLLLDALSYVGHGSWASLETLFSSQLDEAWRLHPICRDMVWLGHIDTELERGSGRLKKWSVSPPTLAYFGEDQAALTGFRSTRLLKEVERIFTAAGGSVERSRQRSQPFAFTIAGIAPHHARELLADLKDPHQRSVRVIDAAAERLASACAALGGLFSLLTPVSTGTPRSPESYDLQVGRWRPAERIYEEGAYRYQDNGIVYVYREASGRTLRGPHELVKLLYARNQHEKLHAYNSATRVFSSRLGCEPAGLLGRALVASSGRLPDISNGQSAFGNVAPEVAAKILEIMYSGELPL